MNLPNKLTLARLVVAMLFVTVVASEIPYRFTAALVLFLIGSATDYFDGYLARRDNIVTAFGKLMDPLADKVLMTAAFVILCENGQLPGWFVVIILTREFLVTGLRLLATSKGRVLAADSLGKLKTVLQITLATLAITALALREWTLANVISPNLLSVTAWILIWATLIITVYSGFRYMWDNRALIDDK